MRQRPEHSCSWRFSFSLMKRLSFLVLALVGAVSCTGALNDAGAVQPQRDTVLRYTLEGADCPFANFAEYGIWVPGGKQAVRGVLVLQHGCTMEQFGITKPYDLQYQAFARKWNLAVLETALHGDCGVWAHPESGSAAALLKVLSRAAGELTRPELTEVPWLIWGHSGGGHWTLGMLRDYPERILAAVCYSAAFDPSWSYPAATAEVPVLLRHAGPQDAPFALCQATAEHSFSRFRSMDAPAAIVCNHGENHNYSQLRHMMIPFFESALRTRLPRHPGAKMRSVSSAATWLGDTLTLDIFPEAGYDGDKSALCRFPDEGAARAWREYAETNDVFDPTPPPAPTGLQVTSDGYSLLVRWQAEADPESGIGYFNIYVDGERVARFPEKGEYQSFDRNGDNTRPVTPPEMAVRLPRPAAKSVHIAVETVNQYGIPSERRASVKVKQ